MAPAAPQPQSPGLTFRQVSCAAQEESPCWTLSSRRTGGNMGLDAALQVWGLLAPKHPALFQLPQLLARETQPRGPASPSLARVAPLGRESLLP